MEHWRAVAEFIGIVAIVASLIFVGQQIQQEQEIAIADTHTSVTSNLADVSTLAIQRGARAALGARTRG